MKRRITPPLVFLAVAGLLLSGAHPADAASVLKRNLVDLISLSEHILVGKVVSVTDGFDNNVPYTEVTLLVEESIRGNAGNLYSFRQFGLTAPRDMGNGQVALSVSPDGWPRFAQDENVVVFLYQAGSLTGLRTTVGLFQGKFRVDGAGVANAANNVGLFENIAVDQSLLSAGEAKCIQSTGGAIPKTDFVGIVRKAVQGQWIEQGVMTHEN